MGTRKQWERWLFENYELVALDPLKSNPKLFSVLIKISREGERPVVKRISTIVDLQSVSSFRSSDWAKIVPKINSYLKKRREKENKEEEEEEEEEEDEDEDEIVETSNDGHYKCNIGQSRGFLVKLLKLVGIKGEWSHELTCEARNVRTEKIDDALVRTLFREQPACWTPNLELIRREYQSNRDCIEVWIVTEMKYCTEMSIDLGGQASAKLSLEVPETGVLPPVSGNVQYNVARNGKLVFSGDKVPFGFKAIRLEYDTYGNVQPLTGPGPAAEYRDDDEEPSNPTYHMGDLFLDVSQEVLECLEIDPLSI